MAILPICMLGSAAVRAQQIAKDGIAVTVLEVKKEKSRLWLEMNLDLSHLKLSSNRFLTLTPMVTDGTRNAVFPSLILSGRRQHIMHERTRAGREDYAGVQEIAFKQGKRQQVPYLADVAYEDWMAGACLVMDEDWCGCGGNVQENGQSDLTCLPAVYVVKPSLAYIVPRTEAVKTRTKTGSAFLDFPVNRTKIFPDYRNNPAELAKIQESIDRLKREEGMRIDRISIHGYASPEGRYAWNDHLARNRAQALKQHVLTLYGFDDQLIEVSSTPEDWEGLRRLTEASGLPEKQQILRIIDSPEAFDEREARLRRLNGGSTYRYILRNWFPGLRHSDYAISYTVPGFDVEEAKRLIKSDPQRLSLNDMFVLSREYEAGSEEFNEVYAVAVRLYPEDPVANLNAANAALAQGEYAVAEEHLGKAGDSPEAIHARGVLALIRGEYEQARLLLVQARDAGVKEAEHNLGELQRKLENNQFFE